MMRLYKIMENGQEVSFQSAWARALHSFRSGRTTLKGKGKLETNQNNEKNKSDS